MNWDTFFESSESVTATEAKTFMESGEPERYQLIDVRQPKEYTRGHIPGAVLIPLAEIVTRSEKLDPDKPTIVYCRSGTRSKAASQLLVQLGFKHVFNMANGFVSWQGGKVEGDVDAGLEFFVHGDFPTTFDMAVQMEYGLQQLYATLETRAQDPGEREMLARLAQFEDGHIAKLKAKYGETSGSNDLTVMEGGLDIEAAMNTFAHQLRGRQEVLELAMKLEAQAYDLYTRLAWKHQGEEIAAFYQEMALDEQRHLMQLEKVLEGLLESQ